MGENVEYREFPRSTAQLAVEISGTDGETVCEGTTRDLSLTGLYVECDTHLPVGTRCRLTLRLGDMVETSIQAEGRVSRLARSGMAIYFSQLPLESYEILQDLVVSDSIDPEAMLKELRRLAAGRAAEESNMGSTVAGGPPRASKVR